MLSELERQAKLDIDLSQMNDDALNRLYLRVFNCPDGQLVLQDLRNRCYVDDSTARDSDKVEKLVYHEGMRSVYLNIITRIANTVRGKKEDVVWEGSSQRKEKEARPQVQRKQ